MQKREYYTLQEIILGLRSEYVNIQKDLNRLKKLCIYNKTLVEGYRFSLSEASREKAEIICEYISKGNFFQNLFKNLNDNLVDPRDINTIICTKDNNDRYYISKGDDWKHSPKYSVTIPCENNEAFSKTATEILTSEFASKIRGSIKFETEESSCEITTKFRGIKSIIHTTEDFGFTRLEYCPSSDSITINDYSGRDISNEYLEKTLSLMIPRESLSPYHIDIIDTSKISKKKIVLEKIKSCDFEIEFEIKESDDEMLLTKVKK